MGFFAIMNPVGNAPIFLGLTDELPRRARRSAALRSIAYAFIIVATFASLISRIQQVATAAVRQAAGAAAGAGAGLVPTVWILPADTLNFEVTPEMSSSLATASVGWSRAESASSFGTMTSWSTPLT